MVSLREAHQRLRVMRDGQETQLGDRSDRQVGLDGPRQDAHRLRQNDLRQDDLRQDGRRPRTPMAQIPSGGLEQPRSRATAGHLETKPW